jgi:hypothetical protein
MGHLAIYPWYGAGASARQNLPTLFCVTCCGFSEQNRGQRLIIVSFSGSRFFDIHLWIRANVGVVALNSLPSRTAHEEKIVRYLKDYSAIDGRNCGERGLRHGRHADFFTDTMEGNSAVSIHGGAGAVVEPIWSDGQRGGVIDCGDDFRVLFVLSPAFVLCRERK